MSNTKHTEKRLKSRDKVNLHYSLHMIQRCHRHLGSSVLEIKYGGSIPDLRLQVALKSPTRHQHRREALPRESVLVFLISDESREVFTPKILLNT